MKLELHMLQNFAPSCLNRDDTNSPKDCVFGGARRARISSQCIKRAIRDWWRQDAFEDLLGKRTNKLIEDVAAAAATAVKADREVVLPAAEALVRSQFVKKSKLSKRTGKLETSYMVFLSDEEKKAVTVWLVSNWQAVKAAKTAQEEAAAGDADADDDEDKSLLKTVTKRLKLNPIESAGISADIAMFGRMLADYPKKKVDAACQVAHAISTHKVEMEMDFFTAVDDLKTDDEDAGAGMMGTIEFNSACFYRYAVLDIDDLCKNLSGDGQLTEKAAEAFLRASVAAVPTGKQNTFAAHNPPDMILAVVRKGGSPLSLANAFAKPVYPRDGSDLIEASADAMKDYWDQTTAIFGREGDLGPGPFVTGRVLPKSLDGWQNSQTTTFDQLVATVMGAVKEASA